MNKEGRQQNSTHIHQSNDLQFVGPWQQVQITEYKQQYQSYHGEVERIEQCADNPCGEYDVTFVHILKRPSKSPLVGGLSFAGYKYLFISFTTLLKSKSISSFFKRRTL